jgi:hypothetical protein
MVETVVLQLVEIMVGYHICNLHAKKIFFRTACDVPRGTSEAASHAVVPFMFMPS